ncbi:MAG: hypothetical protein CM15mP102_15440 [Flavobacteriales bacterium]|nr:MAG: hypothetical protein CM15mP102_15440 [Flavobacteriales bacterium]
MFKLLSILNILNDFILISRFFSKLKISLSIKFLNYRYTQFVIQSFCLYPHLKDEIHP